MWGCCGISCCANNHALVAESRTTATRPGWMLTGPVFVTPASLQRPAADKCGAVVFNLDGTLLDRRRSFEQFVRGQWERFADCLQRTGQEQYAHTLIELDRDGYAPRKSLFTDLMTRFELPSGMPETLLND